MKYAESTYAKVERVARKQGTTAGRDAAAWWVQDFITNNSDSKGVADRTLKGIAKGDPAIMDSFPYLDLSGEWAGTEDREAQVAMGVIQAVVPGYRRDKDDEALTPLWDVAVESFRAAYDDAVVLVIEALCLYGRCPANGPPRHLPSGAVARRQEATDPGLHRCPAPGAVMRTRNCGICDDDFGNDLDPMDEEED